MEVIPSREFSSLYIYLDIAWLLLYGLILVRLRRYTALVAGLLGCLLYFAVDYGIFYLALGTRAVEGADPSWLLLWLSCSYGFTNLAWIWLLLDRDGHALEWSLLTITGWLTVAVISQAYGGGFEAISISRGTFGYQGIMMAILAAGYLYLIIYNLGHPEKKVDLLRLLAIGIGVQFSWEAVLLVTGIRPEGLLPLIVDSLIETNLGLPYLYLIHRAVASRRKKGPVPVNRF